MLGKLAAPAGDDESLGVEQPARAARGDRIRALGDHRRDDQVGDPGGRLAGAEKEQALTVERSAGDAQRGVQPGERDRCGALDVVVEGADPVAVFLQQAERVVVGEVLELDDDARKDLARGGDELVDQRVVVGAGQARLGQAEVERVVAQRLVVGADVEHHRQALRRMDAGARGVERELADRNAHAARAEVAEPEDALAVGDDDHRDVAVRPVAQQRLDLAAVVGA